MMNGMMGGTSMMGMCTMMFIGFLLLILIIGLVVYMVARSLMRNSRVIDNPLMILKERFVKGEITEEEYEQRRNVIIKK